MKKRISISDHAIVRYFERVLKFDMEEVRDWILPQRDEKAIGKNGFGIYPITINYKTTHRVIFKDNTILTIITPDMDYSTMRD